MLAAPIVGVCGRAAWKRPAAVAQRGVLPGLRAARCASARIASAFQRLLGARLASAHGESWGNGRTLQADQRALRPPPSASPKALSAVVAGSPGGPFALMSFALDLLEPFFIRMPSYFGITPPLPPLPTRSTTSSPKPKRRPSPACHLCSANLLVAWPSGSRSQPRWKRIDLEHRLGTYPGPDTVGTQTFGGQPASVDLAAATRQRPAFRARLRPRLPPQAAHRRTLHQAAWKAAL